MKGFRFRGLGFGFCVYGRLSFGCGFYGEVYFGVYGLVISICTSGL